MTANKSRPTIRAMAFGYGAVCLATSAAASASSSTAVRIACAAVQSLAFAALLVVLIRRERAREGVEHTIHLEAAGFAFYTTVLALVTYSLFEQVADAPKISAAGVVLFAALAFVGWGSAIRRRFT